MKSMTTAFIMLLSLNSFASFNITEPCDVIWEGTERQDNFVVNPDGSIMVLQGSVTNKSGVKDFDPSFNHCFKLGDGDDRIAIYMDRIKGVVVQAGEGNDDISIASGNNIIWTEEGDDVVHTGWGNDKIDGGPGKDILHGGEGADDIRGGEGDDTIYGGEGSDQLDGGLGDDIIKAHGETCGILEKNHIEWSCGDDTVYSCKRDYQAEDVNPLNYILVNMPKGN